MEHQGGPRPRWKRLQHAMSDLTTVSGSTDVSEGFLQGQLPLLCQGYNDMSESLGRAINRCSISGTDDEYARFITDFTALLTSLIPRIRLMHIAAAGKSVGYEIDTFQLLWQVLHLSCTAFSSWPRTMLSSYQVYYPPLCAVSSELLTWLLQFRLSSEWGLLTGDYFKGKQALTAFVSPPLACFITTDNSPALGSNVRHMPTSFVPTLCCLASKTFYTVFKKGRGTSQFQSSTKTLCTSMNLHVYHEQDSAPFLGREMAQYIRICISSPAADPEVRDGRLRLLAACCAPASTHFLKLLIIMILTAEKRAKDMGTELLQNCMYSFAAPESVHFDAYLAEMEPLDSSSIHASHPPISETLQIDMWLVSLLSPGRVKCGKHDSIKLLAMCKVLSGWLCCMKAWSKNGPSAIQTKMSSEVQVILTSPALQCTMQALLFMQLLRKEQRSLQPMQGITRQERQDELRQRRPEAAQPMAMRQVCNLLVLTSHCLFQSRLLAAKLPQTVGEFQ